MIMPPTPPQAVETRQRERGFTLIELLVTMTITTVILGATMTAMNDAIKATDAALLLTGMNNTLRTSMDLVVRDLLQVGQGLPTGRVILLPSGNNAQAIKMPGPRGTAFTLTGETEISAVQPWPGLGPVINGQASDVITTLAADSSFDQVRLTALTAAAGGSSMTVDPAENITNGGPNDIDPGDLIMLTKGSLSTLVQVSRVVNQTVFFDPGDSLNLNQTTAASGTVLRLRATAPVDTAPVAPAVFVTTQATRIRMITYYLDNTTDPPHPRLVRRLNNGDPTTFNNNLGTAVAFDIESLQISYDLADGVSNPANVKMVDADLLTTGGCSPSACSPNQIRKVNLLMAARSKSVLKSSRQFLRNRLLSQVSLRSLAFVDNYQ
jgi:prepilin-type N-terminal cleavage/methylation domain-containing protein